MIESRTQASLRARSLWALASWSAIAVLVRYLRHEAITSLGARSGNALEGEWLWESAGIHTCAALLGATSAVGAIWFVRGKLGAIQTLRQWFQRSPLRGVSLGVCVGAFTVLPMLVVHGAGGIVEVWSLDLLCWYLPLGIYGVIVAPVCEECVFRGFLFNVLNREMRMSLGAAAAASALAFAAVHGMQARQPIVPFLERMGVLWIGGMFLCWASWKRDGDLMFPIGFHAGINLALDLIGGDGSVESGRVNLSWALSALAAMGLGVVVIVVLQKAEGIGEERDTGGEKSPHSPH